MDKQIRSRRSGPRTFDRDQAIETAMRLFWRHGYEGVSVSDLTGAIGIAPPSLYAAFGSKAGLYREALDRYETLSGTTDSFTQAESLDEAVAGLFRAAIRSATESPRERGCMVSSGMVHCAPEHDELARDLTARRGAIRNSIAQNLSRWLEAPAADALAGYLAIVMQGLSVHARDGASREDLERIADEAISGIRARRLSTKANSMSRVTFKRSPVTVA